MTAQELFVIGLLYKQSLTRGLKMAANTNLGLVVPTTEKQTVAADMARRRPNAELRSREHLTFDEVERLIAAAKESRRGHRDATVILVAYRHGLRARS